MHCLTAWGQWALQLLQCTASLPGGSGQCNSCNAPPHCPGAVGSETSAMHCRTAWGQWAVQLLQCTAALPGGSGQCNSCKALPHCPRAVGSGTPAMHCLTAWGQWAVELLQCTAPLLWGSGQCNSCNALPHCPGAVGSATLAMHCLTASACGQRTVQPLQCTASLPWVSGQCNSCNTLPHCLGAVGSATPAMHCLTALGQWAVQLQLQPRGCSESPARPMGGHPLQRTGRTGSGGTGSPAQGVFGASCQAYGGQSSSENRAHRPWGDGESSPGGVRSLLPGQWGAIFLREPGAPARGGRGVLHRGCSESPARPRGGHLLQRTGRTGPAGTGSPAQGVFEVSCQANGVPSSPENRGHLPGGDGESCPGGVRSLLPGQWGAIFFREPGAPAREGRGVLPRGCSESPARPRGGHLLQRTGRTGSGGRGSPAQGVFGISCQANGGPSSSENRAHRPGGDGESCPGGVRSLLPGQWGAIFFREPGAPARGGRGVLPRGRSGSPARPMGGHLLQRTGRTGPGGTGSPAEGVFGISCQANGGPTSSENRAHRPWGGPGVLPRGCSESPARPMGGHLLLRTRRTGLGGTGSPAQGVFGVSCQAKGGPSSSENQAHWPGGGRGALPRGCSESPARAKGGP